MAFKKRPYMRMKEAIYEPLSYWVPQFRKKETIPNHKKSQGAPPKFFFSRHKNINFCHLKIKFYFPTQLSLESEHLRTLLLEQKKSFSFKRCSAKCVEIKLIQMSFKKKVYSQLSWEEVIVYYTKQYDGVNEP